MKRIFTSVILMLGRIYEQGEVIVWQVFDVPIISASPHKRHPEIMIHEGRVGDYIKTVRVDYPASTYPLDVATEMAEKWSPKIQANECPRCRKLDQPTPTTEEEEDAGVWHLFPVTPRPAAIRPVRDVAEAMTEKLLTSDEPLRGTLRRRAADRIGRTLRGEF